MKEYPNLFSPLKVGNKKTFKNRLLMAPLTSGNCVVDYRPSDQGIAFYETRAKGGFAQVTVGEADVDREYGCRSDTFCNISDPDPKQWHSMAFYELSRAIRRHGTVASFEINHAGNANHPENIMGNKNPIGPTGYVREDGVTVDEMNEDMMRRVADNFGKAAQYLKSVGFDMCMIHAGHGWLLSQFLSPLTNKRTDKYGISLENRARFPIMVIDRIREMAGNDFLLECRISGEELVEGGLTIDDMVEFSKMIENKVDIIHVSVGIYHLLVESRTFSSMYDPHGCNVHLSGAVKKAVSIPVAVVGGINDPLMAEQIIAEGKADFIALGRQALADPEFPNKALTGRTSEISPCLRCGCFNPMPQPKKGEIIPVGTFECAVNPVTSNEHRMMLAPPVKTFRRIIVAGGGPGGMYAALTAAERGHNVTLIEKTGSLGGLLKFSDSDTYKVDLRRFKDTLIHRIDMLKVHLLLDTAATPTLIEQEAPDALIVAVGSEPIVPDIPGIRGSSVICAPDVYREPGKIGDRVAIIGGGLAGCETGLHLAALGKEILLVEMTDELASDATQSHRIALFNKMDGAVSSFKETKCTGVIPEGVRVLNREGSEYLIEADTVVCAVGMRANSDLALSLCAAAPKQHFVIGDCLRPRKVKQAVHEGFFAALEIY